MSNEGSWKGKTQNIAKLTADGTNEWFKTIEKAFLEYKERYPEDYKKWVTLIDSNNKANEIIKKIQENSED